MSWAQIKLALNSSLGTKEFKPLDELIKGQKTLIASDNLYCAYCGEKYICVNEQYAPEGICFNCGNMNKIIRCKQCLCEQKAVAYDEEHEETVTCDECQELPFY